MQRMVSLVFLVLILTTSISNGQMQPQNTIPPPSDNFQPPPDNNQQRPDNFREPGGFQQPPQRNAQPGMTNNFQQPPPQPTGQAGMRLQQQGAFQSNFGGMYQQPEEMKQQMSAFEGLAAPDLRPQQMIKVGSKVAVTSRVSPEKMVSGMIVERLSEYFDQNELLKNCPEDEKITDKVMAFIDKNDYVLEDICWPVEDRVEDCKLEREQCEEIKQPKTRGGFTFSCPASEESVEKECLGEGEKRLDEEATRFDKNIPAMCEREWLMNEITVTQMCQDNCDEQRFLKDCERQVQNARQRQQQNQPQQQGGQEGWQQPQQWGDKRQEPQQQMQPAPQQQMQPGQQQVQPQPGQYVQPPTQPQPGQYVPPPEGQPAPTQPPTEPAPATNVQPAIPPPTTTEPMPTDNVQPAPTTTEPAPAPTTGTDTTTGSTATSGETTVPTTPSAATTESGTAAPTGYAIAALSGSTDCSKQLENFRQMCKQITEKSDRMCSKDAFISDCKERYKKNFDKEQISKEMKQMCKQDAKRQAVMLGRACRQMEHDYKKCVGTVENACESAQEQATLCNNLMGRDKVKEAVSEKAKELCKFSKYRTIEKAKENASQMTVSIAVASDTTQESIDSLKQLATELTETYSDGEIKLYGGKASPQNYASIKKLDFVIDAKPAAFEKAEGTGIKTAVAVLEANKEQLPEDFRVWVSNEENNLIDVNDKVDDLTKPKGFAYGFKKAFGLAKDQEIKEAGEIQGQSEKLDGTIKSLEDIASQTEDLSAKAAIQGQIKQLKEQKDSFEKMSEERKKNAAGLLSIFG